MNDTRALNQLHNSKSTNKITLYFTFLVPFIVWRSCIPLFEWLHWSASLSFNLAFCPIAWTQALSIFESHTPYGALGTFGCVASTQWLGVTRRWLWLAAGSPLLSLVGQFGVHLCGAGGRHHGWRPHHGLLLGFRTAEKSKRKNWWDWPRAHSLDGQDQWCEH